MEVTNKFKGLDLIECLKDCGWRFVTLYMRPWSKPIQEEMQKGEMFVWGGLTIAEKRREVKGKGKKKTYIHLNADFRRIARRDKKAFLSDQCKEIEENNRIGKTRHLSRTIGYIKGTFHARMGTIKDRNGMDLTEAEDIKKRWQEYREKLYKKIFMTQRITIVWSPT